MCKTDNKLERYVTKKLISEKISNVKHNKVLLICKTTYEEHLIYILTPIDKVRKFGITDLDDETMVIHTVHVPYVSMAGKTCEARHHAC